MSEAPGGLVEERYIGLMIAVPIFLLINAVLAYFGGRMMSNMQHKSSEDVLTAHYLGGRSFGPILSLGTMFASTFSGFAVIGMPNDSYTKGWITFIWLVNAQFVCTVYSAIAPRLRKASIVRNHQSPADFITDMFQSQLLRYTVIFSQFISQFIWMTSNVLSIKSAFNGAFGLPVDFPWLAVGVVAMIVVSEWVGGLAAVALTDTVQGAVMILGSVSVACVIKVQYGGWVALDPETFYRPDFYQTPSRQQQWWWWQLGKNDTCILGLPNLRPTYMARPHLNALSVFLVGAQVFYPIYIQRIYAARDLKSIKAAGWALFFGPWLAMFGAIFIGTMGVQIVGDACQSSSNPAECRNVASPFVAILNILMSIGGFPEVAAIIFYCSALAAVMSTTDSVLISLSQIVTTDILYPMRPNSTPRQIALMGRAVSVAIAAISLVIALSWKGSIILLFELALPISMQIVLAFIAGLYSKYRVHPWSLAIPALAMMIATIFMMAFWTETNVHPGLFTFLVNVAATVIFEVVRLIWTGQWRGVWNRFQVRLKGEQKATETVDDEKDQYDQDPFPARPQWDKPKVKRFGEILLSPQLLDTMMKGVDEPIRDYKYILFVILAFTITTPLVSELQPPLENGVWTYLPPVVRGVPAWFFKVLIIAFIVNFVSLPAIISIPNEYPYSEDDLLRSGIDADAVELEPEELRGRTGYDVPNEKAKSRRHLIKQETQKIKMANEDAMRAFAETRENHASVTEAGAKLAFLVKDPSRRVAFADIQEEEEDEEDEGAKGEGVDDEFEDNAVRN